MRKNSDKKQNTIKSTNFQIKEAYKMARTNIGFSVIKDGCKKIVVSSSLPSEGKTTISANLAIAFSEQVDTKVLLVDCDFRKPKVDKYFNITSVPGITNVISKGANLSEAIKHTEYKNLDVICCGVVPPNPSELLASKQMKDTIELLEKEYDYIIFDTPPINVVSDSLVLIKECDGVVLVVRDGQSKYPEYNKTLEILDRADAKILGVIVNDVKIEKKGKYSYNYKYSGYGGY